MGTAGPRGSFLIGGRPLPPALGFMSKVVAEAYDDWRSGRTIRLGAAIAYYALFAIVPIIAVIAALASFVFSSIDVQDAVGRVSGDLLDTGQQVTVANAVADEIDRASTRAGLGLIGLVSLLLASSLLFVALQDAFNLIWKVPVRRGIRVSARRRLVSFLVVLGLAAILVAILAVRAVGTALRKIFPELPGAVDVLLDIGERLGSVFVLALVTALLLRVLGPVPVRFRALAIGAGTTAVFLVLGIEVLGVYLDKVFTTSLAAAASGVLLFLVWLYYVAQILLAGAHLTRSLDQNLGGQRPAAPAKASSSRGTSGPNGE
jgi:membrane protein